jgi:hypothetical protein
MKGGGDVDGASIPGVSESVVQQRPHGLRQPVRVDHHLVCGAVALCGEADPFGVETRAGRCHRPGYKVLGRDQDRVQV